MIATAFRALNAGLTVVSNFILKLFIVVFCTAILIGIVAGSIPALIEKMM